MTGVEPLLADVKACVFDAYGTLFDTAGAVARCRDAIGADADRLASLWRGKQLEYSWLRSLRGDYVDFWHVTGESLDYALAACRLNDPVLRARLMESYFVLDAYPEVADVLARIRAAGLKTAILSNGSPTMLEGAVKNAGVRELLDAVLSVDPCRIYKPHSSVYALATEHFSLPASDICFVSANGWDAWSGAHFGFRVVWLNRQGLPPERLPGRPVAEVSSLAGLAPLLGA